VEVDAAIQDERAVNLISTQVGPWLRCTRTTGQKLFAALPRECADFILLDAPCSGDTLARREGRGLAKHLRGQPDAASMKEIVATQLEIVRAAWPCLKEGGALVYATCSLRPREDEEIVDQVLKEFDDASLEETGLATSGDAMLRLWPQTHDSAGFFAAKLRKAGDGGGAAAATDTDEAVADAARDYLRDAWGVTSLVGPASSRLVGRGANLWLAPAAPPLAKNLRYERAGAKLVEALKVRGKAVPLGQALRSGRVRATHEFATTLGGHVDAARRASLDDASALAYLRGDDVDAAPPSGEPGDQCLVAHGGRVLGLAKVLKGGRLKNQLPRECVRRDLAF
jgi:16S rRNA (cytosine1407-C5)-methyltransferase